jgi:hypothetical protein
MGMFDNVSYECACPVCHDKVDGFQSKDGECIMETLEPSQVCTFYTTCGNCGCWLEFNATKHINTKFILTAHGKGHKPLKQYTKTININKG